MTHYERMDIEDRGGNDENYPRFSEQQFLDMGKFFLIFLKIKTTFSERNFKKSGSKRRRLC